MTCYDHALMLLGAREHTKAELSAKLAKKGYPEEEIEASIERLSAEGLQSDRRFCEIFIRSRLRKNPEGKSLLILRMIQKGVDKQTARECADLYFEEHAEEIEKIYSDYKEKLVRAKGEEKAMVTLERKGIRISDGEA